ncbi:MAG: hypothetical protein AAB624_01600 [Patescibacteria group bacterium]
MKWLPRSKKSLLLLIPIVVLAGGLAYFVLWTGNKNDSALDDASSVNQIKEVKVADILLQLSENASLKQFGDFMSATDLSTKLVVDTAGVLPKLMLFAPSNAAFKKDEMIPLASTPEPAKEDLRLYHAAIFYPNVDGTGPDLSLSKDQKIKTLSGRELLVSKVGSHFVLTDAKARAAKVDLTYQSDTKGNRLYFIDSVLLLQ